MNKNKSFLLLWTGKFVSELGDKFYAISMAWWILEESGSPINMGLYLAFSIFPGILAGIFAGAYIDRLSPKKLLIIMDAIRGIIIFCMAWLYFTGNLNIWHAFLSAMLVSIASSFFNPAVITIIPRLVDKESLTKANSFIQMVDGIATVIGPVIGAGVAILHGFTWVFALNGLSFLLSALFECFIKVRAKEQSVNLTNTSILEDIKEGFKYLKQNPNMIRIMLIIGFAHFFIGAIVITMPFIAKSIDGNGIQALGYMEMALGLGFIIGAMITSSKKTVSLKINRLFGFLITVGLCFICIGVVSLQLINDLILYVIIIFIVGFAIVNASIYWQTFIQSSTPENMLGRMSAISSLVGDATLPISFTLFGILLDLIQFEYLMIFSGFILVVFFLKNAMSEYRNDISTMNS